MLDLAIREQIARFVAGEVSAFELEDQLEEVCWTRTGSPDPGAETALRLLAEYGNGDWTDAELAGRLDAIARTYLLQQAPAVVFGGSSSPVILEDQLSAPADRWRVAEPV